MRPLQSSHQLFEHVFVGDQAAQRGAALAGRSHRAEEDGAQRELEVGAPGHDHGVVATQLSRQRPKRSATRGATSRPIRQLPVALISGTRGSVTRSASHFASAQEQL